MSIQMNTSDAKLYEYIANNYGQYSDRLLECLNLPDFLTIILAENTPFTKEKDWNANYKIELC